MEGLPVQKNEIGSLDGSTVEVKITEDKSSKTEDVAEKPIEVKINE